MIGLDVILNMKEKEEMISNHEKGGFVCGANCIILVQKISAKVEEEKNFALREI